MSNSNLQIVKEEPTEPHTHSHSPNPKSIPHTTTSNIIIPPLPNVPTPAHTQSNPFGPTHYTHTSPPFNTYNYPPQGPPGPPCPPPMPFGAPPFPPNHSPATHPMFYPPVFHYNQPPPPPSHYNDNTSPSTHDNTPPSNIKKKVKPYSFTPGIGMQPGAYYLIPLAHKGDSQHHRNAYMPLINNNSNKNKETDSDISSNTSSSDDSSENNNNNVNVNANAQPFINQMPAPQFPPPPIPLPYTDINSNNAQFSIKNNEMNGDKKNIKHKSLQTSFMMQPQSINNINTNQPLSFPPLPTNNSMTQSNVNHLNSNFADEQGPMLTPERGDSSDQDMDVALGTNTNTNNINNIMPIIQQNENTNNINNNSYYHITPYQNDKKVKKIPKNKRKSPKKIKSTKKIRKHSNKQKVSNSNIYQDISVNDISVNVPKLNKMNVSAHQLAHKATINGRRITRKRKSQQKKQKLNDIPDLSDHENSNTNNSKQSNKKSKQNTSIPIPPPICEKEGQMEVAYSQQYPQVGFPYIYNSDGDNGKKFTCKFMDSALSMVDGEPQFCDRQFGQKCHWMRHCLEKHVPTEMSQRYQCRYCNMKYAQNSSLKEHVAICHSNKPPSFKCPYCSGDITFTRWTSVLRHCRNQHPDQEEPKKVTRRGNNSGNNNRKKRKNNRKRNNNSNNNRTGSSVMDLDRNGLGVMNIMPSVNMNISMNQMLNSNNYIVPANVAILPPDNGLSRNNGIR